MESNVLCNIVSTTGSLCKSCKTGLPDIMELQMSHTNLNLLTDESVGI